MGRAWTLFGSISAVVVSVLLFVVVPASASVHLLPAFGRVFLEVEIVVNRSNVIKVRTATVTGDVKDGSVYPFYVERLYDNALVRTFAKSATELYVVTDQLKCAKETTNVESNDNVVFWKFLRSVLTDTFSSAVVDDAQFTYRGIKSHVSQATASLTIPIEFGGSGKEVSYSVKFFTNDAKVELNFQKSIRDYPLTVLMTDAAAVETTMLTFSYLGSNVTSNEELSVPPECSAKNTPAVTVRKAALRQSTSKSAPPKARAASDSVRSLPRSVAQVLTSDMTDATSAQPSDYKMPALPDKFSANFQVIAPDQGTVRFMRNSFNTDDLTCYTTLQSIYPDAVGRVSLYEWYIQGKSQLTYYHESTTVLDSTKIINSNIQQYFWPDSDSCKRSLIGYDVLASSGADIFMLKSSVTPMFVGNRTVRNIPCGAWSAPVNGARVTWYFASDPSSFDSHYTTDDSDSADVSQAYGKLVRIAVEGFGSAAAFFVHHPFFAQGYAFPSLDRRPACWQLTPFFPSSGCYAMSTEVFTFYYEVTSFVPYVPYDDSSIPVSCEHTLTGSAFPSATCSFQGGIPSGAAAVLFVLVAIAFLFLGSCCMWCRYAPLVRGLQEDMIRLAEELRRREENADADPTGGEGESSAVEAAAGEKTT